MASPAAEAMYNALTPAQRAVVDASIAGNPNGKDDWYQNAAKAGDPAAIRAGAQGQSEDFARFNEGTVTGWAQQYYDEAASRAAGRPQFRSMRGAEGFFDKPTECPPGTGPSGPNESDPCTAKGYSEPGGAGDVTGGTGTTGGGQSLSNTYSPLRDLLANQGSFLGQFDPIRGDNQAGVRGGTVGGGGIWWQPNGQTTTARVGAAQPVTAPNSVGWTNPNIGATGGPLGGAQTWGGTGTRAPATGALNPSAVGWTDPNVGATGAPLGGAQAWGGTASSKGQPVGSVVAPQTSLTALLAPLQGQQAPSYLGSTMAPLMGRQRRNSPLTGTLMNNQAGRWF